MRVGIIGVGVVGGTLRDWFKKFTTHELRLVDPAKGLNDSLEDCKAIFVSVPVPSNITGQDQRALEQAVKLAKEFTTNVFIRSTVLPGTNDRLKTISMPEFLTERKAFLDMCTLPILLGSCEPSFAQKLFPDKRIYFMSNTEAELAKFAHNCFGAVKVTYFNIISELCKSLGANFDKVKVGAGLTGYIEPMHTTVPGPDGKFGYGGKCFPENMEAMKEFLFDQDMADESSLFRSIELLNNKYRYGETTETVLVRGAQ